MKKLTILIILTFISISLKAQESKITIIGENITISQAFEQIEAQTKYTIAYNQTKFNAEQKLTKSIKDASIEKALTTILKGTGFTYKISASHIVIKEIDELKPSNKTITQTIRGIVKDAASEEPIPYASVALLNTSPLLGTSTDSLGVFRFDKIPVGRYDIEISSIGYDPVMLAEVLLTSGKELYYEIMLKEQLQFLEAAVVRPKINKEAPLNSMALAGGRMFSVEETSRYAGGFDDPARLVSSFAGVAGGVSTNNISVHGNSPQFLQWRLEGIEIPNPTHFSDMIKVGGGIVTALSSQVMGNSDFFNGAFPAEYSNALAGVFDMSMRNGNNQKYEHTFQVGIMGIDAASEGPISKKNGSSYIINYRYSTTGILSALTDDLNLKYQDLSFKLNFPTRKAGTFSFWGFGLIDHTTIKADDQTDPYQFDFKKFATGIGHKIFLGKGMYLKTSLAATYGDKKQFGEIAEISENTEKVYKPVIDMYNQQWDIILNTYLNKKFGARHTNRTGVTITGLFYDLDFKVSPTVAPSAVVLPMNQIAIGNASSSVVSVFSNSLINITNRLSTNIGVTAQLFTLNNTWTLEPRVSLKYKIAPRHSIAIAYGLHSRRETLDYYYAKTPATGDELVNKNLDFAKANHLTLSYNWNITDNVHLRIEPYFQFLSDVPVEPGTSFSIINHNLYYMEKPLVNQGKGRNYGIDLTLEQYLNKGFYWLLTGTLFNSEYVGGDGVWRNSRYNRKFVTNALVGKEWLFGKQKQNAISANIKVSYLGGEYYTPVNVEATHQGETIVLDETKAYSEQYSPTLIVDFTISYKLSKKKTSHEFAIKVLNVTDAVEPHGFLYNQETKTIEENNMTTFLPNISYKIYF